MDEFIGEVYLVEYNSNSPAMYGSKINCIFTKDQKKEMTKLILEKRRSGDFISISLVKIINNEHLILHLDEDMLVEDDRNRNIQEHSS